MTFALIPGAGGDAWYWHRVVPLLEAAGHDVVAVALPAADDDAGLDAYVEATIAQLQLHLHGHATDELIVVGQSMGAFTAPLVAERLGAALIVLVCPMIPAPGETGGDWWSRSGQLIAQREQDEAEGRDPDAPFDVHTLFFHDVPRPIVDEAFATPAPEQSDRPFADPWPLERWPDIPTRVVAGRHDRLLPLPFVQRLARARLHVTADVVDSGHLPALAAPAQLAERLRLYAAETIVTAAARGR